MSTSHTTAFVESTREIAALLLLSLSFAAPAVAQVDRVGLAASPGEIRQASLHVLSALQNQDDLPDEPSLSPKTSKTLWWSSHKDGKHLLVPVTIRYSGLLNSYCRLVTMSADFRNSHLVQVPPQVNFDDCLGVADTLYFDINGDGFLDVIQGLRVKSNRYAAKAIVPVVYLSSAAENGGYCYSEKVSRQIQPSDLRSEATAMRSIEEAKLRLGWGQFECSK
jgi:hypothetical protein